VVDDLAFPQFLCDGPYMGRPKHTDPDLYISGEIAEATGMVQRNLQMLRDNKTAGCIPRIP
jgi:hypothetical protein